ncbi:MAG: hypothetical protein KAW09_06245 [Thermoplasmata archaeon]|nr:hypothetical protein [Thermoplasmata archaeon]
MESLSLLRLLVGITFIGFASYSDLKTRRVNNRVWMILGLIGFIILAVDLSLRSETFWAHYLIFIPVGILFYDVYLDREPIIDDDGFQFVPVGILLYAAALIVLILQGYLTSSQGRLLFIQLLTIPAMIVLAHIFFHVGLLKGGADAKALMAFAVLVPFYPEFYGFPLIGSSAQINEAMSILFPFALVILMNSAILVLFVPLVFLVINARRGNLQFPQCLLGYKVALNEFPEHTWLMERAEGGAVRIVLFPGRSRDTETEVKALRELGKEEAWATPQIPFMIPMFFGLIISFFIGNLILGVIYALT